MVSLQAILQDVAQYPNVIGATLHNVDNKLLLQSGFKPKQIQQGKRYNFTAAVALHNNVAGYLDVTIEVPRRTAQDELFLICWAVAVLSALFIMWWSIYRRWWSSMRDKLPSASAIVTAVVDTLPNIAEAPVAQEPMPAFDAPLPPTQIGVRLSIQITNLSKLYQQLNSEGFSIAISRFDRQIQNLLKLYSGHRQLLISDTLIIDFSGEEFHECSFRAICCAQILINMAARNPSPRLHLAATIQPLAAAPQTTTPVQTLLKDFIVQFNNALTPSKNDILISLSLLDSTLQEHAEFDCHRGKLLAIKAPFCDYLAKQEEQLLSR